MAGQPVEKSERANSMVQLSASRISTAAQVTSETHGSPLESLTLSRGGTHQELRTAMQRDRASEQAAQLLGERERHLHATQAEEGVDIFTRLVNWLARVLKQFEQRLLGRLNQIGPLGRILGRRRREGRKSTTTKRS